MEAKVHKEFCKCGHSKKYHIIGDIDNICCAMWQSKENGYIRGCECEKYVPEEKFQVEKEGVK